MADEEKIPWAKTEPGQPLTKEQIEKLMAGRLLATADQITTSLVTWPQGSHQGNLLRAWMEHRQFEVLQEIADNTAALLKVLGKK
jgi:hypothetical protein